MKGRPVTLAVGKVEEDCIRIPGKEKGIMMVECVKESGPTQRAPVQSWGQEGIILRFT